MKYQNIREEELKNKVGQDYFSDFDTTKIVGNIDFCITPKTKDKNQQRIFEEQLLLWAEAKTGDFDVVTMFVQLIITIGKARTFDKNLPPAFLGAFDFRKIAFVPYEKVQHIFFKNDFNWNVTPSNHETKEFIEIKNLIENILSSETYVYNFNKDDKELHFFIENNVAKATESGKIQIDKNNFVPIYLRWLDQVKPFINFDFAEGKKQNILDSDFYLADLFVDDHDTQTIDDDTPLKNELFIVFRNGHYEIAKENLKSLFNASIEFKDKKAYEQFWKKYKRPPIKIFQDYIIDRRDLLVPQDIRERKGAFFTPKQWVELSQKYIADVLGENWQDEYYVWDCAAGTGNLLAGLTNKYNIWASTLDQADVNVMHDRIKNGAILLESHVFQFDFLNDDFSKLPQSLQDIINNPEKRKKLVIYINPPYAEGDNVKGIGRKNVQLSKIHDKYHNELKKASGELFAQFFARIYVEIPNCKLAEFSKLKMLQAPNFADFRLFFQAYLKKLFLVPADTFDNVNGKFPIGFFFWDTSEKDIFKGIYADVFNEKGFLVNTKFIQLYDNSKYISDWLEINSKNIKNNFVGHLASVGNDFQNQRMIFIDDVNTKRKKGGRHTMISKDNLIIVSIYFAVRHCIEATWLNDRDQFLFPNDGWESDTEFQNDCFTYTLLNNNIQSKFGTNHWIPYTEYEVGANDRFESDFMTKFIQGKLSPNVVQEKLFVENNKNYGNTPLVFSKEATECFNAGRKLWKYYHSQPNCNVNASLYDIREHFQGRNEAGKMNNKSTDETYTHLISELRENLKLLALKIQPKVYDYGFLK